MYNKEQQMGYSVRMFIRFCENSKDLATFLEMWDGESFTMSVMNNTTPNPNIVATIDMMIKLLKNTKNPKVLLTTWKNFCDSFCDSKTEPLTKYDAFDSVEGSAIAQVVFG